jgi:tetrahydromethanopterin S-methyltransferase subunit F
MAFARGGTDAAPSEVKFTLTHLSHMDLDVVSQGGRGVVESSVNFAELRVQILRRERTFSSGTFSTRKNGPAPSWSTRRLTVASMSSTT